MQNNSATTLLIPPWRGHVSIYRLYFSVFALCAGCLLAGMSGAGAAQTLTLEAFDQPGDRGGEIGLVWPADARDTESLFYVVLKSASPEGPFEEVQRFEATQRLASDSPGVFGWSRANRERHYTVIEVEPVEGKEIEWFFRVELREAAAREGGAETTLAVSNVAAARARANWFSPQKINNLIVMIFCCGFVLYFIQRAKKNRNIFIRKLAGLEAIDEAVGRATEMGKPILYLTGYHDMDRVSTMASVNILEHVARKVAEFDSRLLVPSKWSIAMTVCQEVVKEAYTNAGRPDAYNPNDIWFIAGEQFSYTAAVDGLMVREKPAANFFLGTFAAEALILAETGASTGAIQISGTDSTYQIPFFVVACDYCLIGEELYVASAYLSREPKLLGSLKGQDAGKLLVIAAILFGSIAMTLYQFGPFQRMDALLWIKNFFISL